MNNALHLERLMALAWKAADQADKTELTAALRQFRASALARLNPSPGVAGKAEASRELSLVTDKFVKAITDAHWCVLMRAGVESESGGVYQNDAEFIRAFNDAVRSIAQAYATALRQTTEAMWHIAEQLRLSSWELATARYLIHTASLSAAEHESGGMAEGDHDSPGVQQAQNPMVTLVINLAALLSPEQD